MRRIAATILLLSLQIAVIGVILAVGSFVLALFGVEEAEFLWRVAGGFVASSLLAFLVGVGFWERGK